MFVFPFEDVLCSLARRIPSDARWGVSCGSALALHNLDYAPGDLDFFAPRDDASRIIHELSDLTVVFPFQRRVSGVFDCSFGRYKVNGIEIDVVGDFSVRWNDHVLVWNADHPCWSHLKFINIQQLNIPIFSLEDLLLIYTVLPHEEVKVDKIVNSLESFAERTAYIKLLTSQTPGLEGKVRGVIDR
jgi:hypothetical protein